MKRALAVLALFDVVVNLTTVLERRANMDSTRASAGSPDLNSRHWVSDKSILRLNSHPERTPGA